MSYRLLQMEDTDGYVMDLWYFSAQSPQQFHIFYPPFTVRVVFVLQIIVACSFFCNFIVDGVAYSFALYNEEWKERFPDATGWPVIALIGSLLNGVYLLMGIPNPYYFSLRKSL